MRYFNIALATFFLLSIGTIHADADTVIVKIKRDASGAGALSPLDVSTLTGLTGLKRAFNPANKSLAAQAGLDRFYISGKKADPESLRQLRQNKEIESTHTLTKGYLTAVPNDPDFPNQWGLHNYANPGVDIRATEAWNISTGSPNVIIAVIDSGVDFNHPDLQGRVWRNTLEFDPPEHRTDGIDNDSNGYTDDWQGWNFSSNNNDVSDPIGHGTRVAGLIGAAGNNGLFISGVLWNCRIMPVKVTDSIGGTDDYITSQAVIYAVDNGAKVINMSLAFNEPSPLLQSAVNYANLSGATVVAAMGNDGDLPDPPPHWPAAFESVIAVGAIGSYNSRWYYSNFGSHIDVTAPGVNLPTLNKGGGTYIMSGTSASCALVSGVCGLALSVNPNITPTQMRNLLIQNATDLAPSGFDIENGYGNVNAFFTLQALQDLTPPTQPIVSVASLYSYDPNTISFSWTPSSDPESGIAGYEYAIGNPGSLTAHRNWTPVGNVTNFTATGIGMLTGEVYIVSVRARNGVRAWSTPGESPMVRYAPLVSRITDVMTMPNGSYLTILNKVVTSKLSNRTWVREQDRSSAIAVNGIVPANEGNLVSVSGLLNTTGLFRVIDLAEVKVLGSGGNITPFVIRGKSVGGSDLVPGVPGITGGEGLYNIGQLVTIAGKVTDIQSNHFHVDDGSGATGFLGKVGIKVITNGLVTPTDTGISVKVTGIVEVETYSGVVKPVIRIRRAADYQPQN